MGFFDKVVSVGSQFMDMAERNMEREQNRIRSEIKSESYSAREKSDIELKKQFSNKDNSYASRYAAKSELERRGY